MSKIKIQSHLPGVMNDDIRQMVLQNNMGYTNLSKAEFANSIIGYSLPLQYMCYPEFEFVGNDFIIKEYGKHTLTLIWHDEPITESKEEIENQLQSKHLLS